MILSYFRHFCLRIGAAGIREPGIPKEEELPGRMQAAGPTESCVQVDCEGRGLVKEAVPLRGLERGDSASGPGRGDRHAFLVEVPSFKSPASDAENL